MMVDFPRHDYNTKDEVGDKDTTSFSDKKEVRKIPMTAESWEDWTDKLK